MLEEDTHQENAEEVLNAADETISTLETASALPSKNQLKRIRREEYLKQKKRDRKDQEKKRKLEIRLAKPVEEKKAPIVIDPAYAGHTLSRKEREANVKDTYLKACAKNFSVIIDCGWDKQHSDSNLKSLSQQIMFCYGANKRHTNPAFIHITGLGPLLQAKLSKVLFESWVGVSVSHEDYIANTGAFSVSPQQPPSDFSPPASSTADAIDVDSAEQSDIIQSQQQTQKQAVKQLVYLTSDAEDTLETLDLNCAYIIGGIVDRNSMKGATYNKAKSQGIRTAKLPIKENFALSATHVLTVNHVFDILLNFSKCHSWKESIEQVLPKRKNLVERGAVTSNTSTEAAAADEEEQEEVDREEKDGEAAEEECNEAIEPASKCATLE